MIDRHERLSIADVVIDRFQVRKANTGEGIDELAASIKSFGLLHPIVVCRAQRDPSKWEVVCGQRRLLAHKKLGLAEISAGIIDKVLSEEEGLAISGNENIFQLDMSRVDLIDLCEQLYLRYGTIKAVWEKTRLPMEVVRKYVRYSRLEPTLKELVDKEAVPVDMAVKVQDSTTVDGVFQKERALELMQVLRESDDELRKRILEVNGENPMTAIEKVVENAKKPDERLRVQFTLGPSQGRALRKYAEDQGGDPQVVAQDIVEESLRDMGFLGSGD